MQNRREVCFCRSNLGDVRCMPALRAISLASTYFNATRKHTAFVPTDPGERIAVPSVNG